MPLALDDGYTVPFTTDDVLTDVNGMPIERVTSVITGRYRPPVLADTEAYRYAITRAQSGHERAKIVAEFICARVTDWDVTLSGQVMKLDPPTVAKYLPSVYAELVMDQIRKWKPKDQEAAAGNS